MKNFFKMGIAMLLVLLSLFMVMACKKTEESPKSSETSAEVETSLDTDDQSTSPEDISTEAPDDSEPANPPPTPPEGQETNRAETDENGSYGKLPPVSGV